MQRVSLALFMMVAGCQQAPAPANPVAENQAPMSRLEQAAIESGAIADVSRISPVGLYQRSHEAGRDALCVARDKAGHFLFGMEAMFGEGLGCRGHGLARRAGDKLILSFRGGDKCIVVAQYDGDRVALPGVVDMACADLCDGNATLEGVSFPRVANDPAHGRSLTDHDGEAICPN